MKLTIEDLGYVEEMRKRLGLNEENTSADERILAMTPIERVELIAGWYLGSGGWAYNFKTYFESQGLFLTTNPDANGVLLD